MKRIIVSRHPAAVAFIRRELPSFADAPVLASASVADVAGALVAGNLPLDLACATEAVFTICYPKYNAPRGQEYSLADMDAAGATIRVFMVVEPDFNDLGFDVWQAAEDAAYPVSR